MSKTITYTNAVKLTEEQWEHFTEEQKIRLLKSINASETWAETKTIKEMVKRGGGVTARSLLRLNRLYLQKNGGKVTITWT